MASLTGTTIASTYPLLLKMASGAVASGLAKVQDGAANDSALSIGTVSIAIDNQDKLFFDGTGGDTYIQEASGGDILDIVVGGATMMKFTETTTDKIDILSEIYVGVDGTGHDVKFFGDSNNFFMLWDYSANCLNLEGTSSATGFLKISTTAGADAAAAPQLIIDGNTGGGSPGLAAGILLNANTNERGKGIVFSSTDDNQRWFCGVPYGTNDPERFQIGYHDHSTWQPHYTANAVVSIIDGGTASGSTGKMGIGNISPAYKFEVLDDAASSYCARFYNDGDNHNRWGIIVRCGAEDGSVGADTTYIDFQDSSGTRVGSIAHDSGTGNMTLNATSDSRLKENIADTQLNGLSLCNQIKVREFNWKDSSGLKNRAGFIAQELVSVFPEAVSGTDGAMIDTIKEESYVNDDGVIIPATMHSVIDPMSVSQNSLIPIIMKAIQELSIKVTALENA